MPAATTASAPTARRRSILTSRCCWHYFSVSKGGYGALELLVHLRGGICQLALADCARPAFSGLTNATGGSAALTAMMKGKALMTLSGRPISRRFGAKAGRSQARLRTRIPQAPWARSWKAMEPTRNCAGSRIGAATKAPAGRSHGQRVRAGCSPDHAYHAGLRKVQRFSPRA